MLSNASVRALTGSAALLLIAACGGNASQETGGACEGLAASTCSLDRRCTWVDSCCGAAAHCASVGVDYHCDDACPSCEVATTEAACLTRPDCVATYCGTCGCADTFAHCGSRAEAPYTCPPIDCVGTAACCHSDQDCTSPSYLCLAPGAFPGCGACYAGDGCQVDADCGSAGSTQICEVPGCTCDSEKACIGGCAEDSSCGLGRVCGEDHRCRPKPCLIDTDCPQFFGCDGDGACSRTGCDADEECPGGACVNGGCYDGAGTCTSPPS